MWPKRKKSKARATKLKLKAMQAPNEQQGQQQEFQDFDDVPEAEPQAEPPQAPRNQQDELISGVWKSKVLNNYKQNPKNSHNLLARIPTGKAAFEAGERQKAELIKEAMIKVVDRMFDNFQNTAYEFNQVTGGTNLELSWIRPHFVQEEVSNWHDSTKVTYDVFVGRISTRYWTLAVRGTATAVDTYILPSEKLLGFSTTPSNYPTYLSLVAECDGLSVDWLVAKKPLEPDILPSVYRALLDGLIRFASEEALPGETFRLEDIGIVPEATAPSEEPLGYQSVDKHDLLGQSSARNKVVSPRISSPSISSVSGSGSSSADRFIDNISNQVAQAAQNETDRFRESMQAPPFGTSTRAPGGMSQSGVMRASVQPQDLQQVQAVEENDGDSDDDGQWKSVASDQAVRSDWQKYMEATKKQVKQQAKAAPADDDNWNSLPGTEKLARTELRGSQAPMSSSQVMQGAQMSNSQVMQGVPYPSYGNSADPPELLKPADHSPLPQIDQSGGYPNYPGLSQSGVNSAQQAAPPKPSVSSQSGVSSTQPYPNQQGINQSGVHSTQSAPPAYQNQPAINQSGAFSTQQSGVYSAQQPQLPPQMMPPGYNQPMGMPQQPQMMQPGMANHPGLPSMPGMINPTLGQSGVHQQPRLPEQFQKAVPPQGLIAPPPGMIQMTPPQGMSPVAPIVPPQMVPGYPGDPHQPAPGSVAARYAEQQRAAALQAQYTTGGQQALPPQYDTGRQQAIPPQQYNTGAQSAVPPQFNTGGQPALPPPYNVGAQQSPAQYNTDAHQQLQLQYAQGGYATTPVPDSPPSTEDSESYLLSESDVDEQAEQYPEEYPAEEQAEEEGWQPEDEQSEEVEIEEVEVELEVEEATWEEPANSAFSNSAFPQESFNELPVMSNDALQKFEAANKAGFVFSSENDLVDAISVVLDTIDSQIELLAQQGTEAFRQRDFRRAEAIIKLSERLTSFKSESQAILQLMSENEQ